MKQIKGPKTPRLWQTIQWNNNPVSYMEDAAAKFPDLFKAQIAPDGKYQVLLVHPQAIQELFTKPEFVNWGNSLVSPVFGDESLLFQVGDRHQRQRKLLMPPFHGERMRSYGQLVCEITDRAISKIPLNQTVSTRAVMEEISLQVILKAVFGLDEGERCQQLKQLLLYWARLFHSPIFNSLLFFSFLQQDWGSWSPWGKFIRKRQQIHQLLFSEIRDRRANPDPDRTDILSMLLSALHEDGEPMSDLEIRDQLLTLLLTGYETTATAMAWTVYWSHFYPEIKAKLLQEIDHLGDEPAPVDIVRLPYLTAFCQETLRINPVVPLTAPRTVESPVELMGYELEPGTIIHGCIYALHQREEIYPNPRQFRPERFLERQFSHYEFIPFGGGKRLCIGAALAMFEMKLVLATILSRYQIALADERPVKLARLGITLVPDGGIEIIVKARRVTQQSQKAIANYL
ncbi:MAG: cytochrome P450 [Pleurocapsa sp. MO_226.B13]|nr:cytochrome P450 [Pleurocapsa sp. MO_226.B13]